jgi:type I restriction enzyme S subunit
MQHDSEQLRDRQARGFAWSAKIGTECAPGQRLCPVVDQTVFAKDFRGELVPQDPNDEPVSVLLERIKAEREGAGASDVGALSRIPTT